MSAGSALIGAFSVDERRDEVAAGVLLLLDAPTLGPRRVLELLNEHGSPDVAHSVLLHAPSTKDRLRTFLRETSPEAYLESVRATRAVGGDYKLWSDRDYPKNLARWGGRPPVLFFKGDLTGLGERSLALVGRVDPSPEGVEAATRFARKCVENEITVVSGLAKGIDGASHAAALVAPPGRTYAVLGHGLDFAYPRENKSLYETIPQNGALISQFRTGIGPQRWTFPARNEVMCTLALGTVIVEGAPGCGSLIQADFSFKHHRPVFVLARNLRNGGAEWADPLVSRGAHVIETFDQVLDIVAREVGSSWRVAREPEQPPLFGSSTPQRERVVACAALFDVDGVIVDTRDAHVGALVGIASSHLGRPVDASRVVATGKPHDALARLGVPNAYDVYRSEYDAAFTRSRGDIKVFEEVVAALEDLSRAGVALGAVTAQPKRRADYMLPPRVRDLFSVFLCYSDTKGRKEVGINLALCRLKIDPAGAVFVGDQPADLEAARKAGVRSIGVLWGFSSEDELRRWPHELLAASPDELVGAITSLIGDA